MLQEGKVEDSEHTENNNDDDSWNPGDSRPEDALDSDGFQYLNMLEATPMWTRVESDCVCFPDLVERRSELQLDAKRFCHAYRVPLEVQNGTHTIVLPDCQCKYAQTVGQITRGGFDQSDLSLEDLLSYFEVGEPCLHARSLCDTFSIHLFFLLFSPLPLPVRSISSILLSRGAALPLETVMVPLRGFDKLWSIIATTTSVQKSRHCDRASRAVVGQDSRSNGISCFTCNGSTCVHRSAACAMLGLTPVELTNEWRSAQVDCVFFRNQYIRISVRSSSFFGLSILEFDRYRK